MAATIIDGKAVAAGVRARVAEEVKGFADAHDGHVPGLATVLVGDDPASKSSTVPAVSERSLAAMGVPVLFPRNAEEIITMGMHAVALSRASGCVVPLKIVADRPLTSPS